jgi:Fe2+ or Zn2+ uptake regulation protein
MEWVIQAVNQLQPHKGFTGYDVFTRIDKSYPPSIQQIGNILSHLWRLGLITKLKKKQGQCTTWLRQNEVIYSSS